ncbi:MAG TPA: 1,3-beta-galactosyl-N-acetylhexosamine phosphorylase N-terminal domain-containing protein, partial [Clostridia bacterium]|nr:1,3-beta-galactosyl-N-acetylhexosamine phosphorylase N-terminal domain-containing protein [Clostridia bacterium]
MREGRFTLPGEAGYERLTLDLAKRWGADVIRDSDGTTLSEEILDAGYDVYSTLCIVRDHNEWIRDHPDARQQCFLCTAPAVAEGTTLAIDLMSGFFDQQFAVNDGPDALAHWQVYDRTTGRELPASRWRYDAQTGTAIVQATPWHRYTANFLAYRIWEEISMYNHVTNCWEKEHLMQLDPYHPEARAHLRRWLTDWCKARPHTSVVRFTSLYYNFAWIWGSDPRNRNLFTDWASYDFTVSPAALRAFEKRYGYALCAEDFVRAGKHNATHRVPTPRKRDWMDFVGEIVRDIGREHVDIVHQAGKKAYVFYDDSWVGMEPYGGRFESFGFDGIIKCVFSGYEARLCAGVPVATHELRFHPYLFPV